MLCTNFSAQNTAQEWRIGGIFVETILQEAEKMKHHISNSKEYLYYKECQKKLKKDKELYDKVNEFRKKNFELQSCKQDESTLQEAEQLYDQYQEYLNQESVIEFFDAERKICNIMRQVYDTLAEALEFDLDFLE